MIGVTPIRKIAISVAPTRGTKPVMMLTPPASSNAPVPRTARSGAGTPCIAAYGAIVACVMKCSRPDIPRPTEDQPAEREQDRVDVTLRQDNQRAL